MTPEGNSPAQPTHACNFFSLLALILTGAAAVVLAEEGWRRGVNHGIGGSILGAAIGVLLALAIGPLVTAVIGLVLLAAAWLWELISTRRIPNWRG